MKTWTTKGRWAFREGRVFMTFVEDKYNHPDLLDCSLKGRCPWSQYFQQVHLTPLGGWMTPLAPHFRHLVQRGSSDHTWVADNRFYKDHRVGSLVEIQSKQRVASRPAIVR